MNRVYRHTVAIGLILLISLGVGLAYNALADLVERHLYPQDFSEYVTTYATRYGIPEDVVYATIKVESNFESNAVSHVGCIGLMQIEPEETFPWLQSLLGESLGAGMLYDPETNIRYGTYYLSYLYSQFGSWDLAHAAYNAGPGNVSSWLKNEEYTNENGELIHIPFKETRTYVERIAKAKEHYKALYSDNEQ